MLKKYVLVGAGNRGVYAYAIPMVKNYSDYVSLSGVYDVNPKRATLVSEITGAHIPVYDDFEKMLDEVKPDSVIVVCRDCDHDYYIIKAMEKGCDVISEKPLTTTFEKALAIKEAKDKYKKDLIVTFNLRFQPFFRQIKELIKSGEIGDILSIHYEWMLNTSHGADYFRRWHRERKNSGSLLIHKSTHHFDLANWFLEEDPVAVNAFGTRRFYGAQREEKSERCLTCPYKDTCEFYFDIEASDNDRRLYYECEDADGYFRDKCVFSDEIDIEDSLSVSVEYSGGAIMSYSLTAHSPYEGLNISINGTKARMEIKKTFKKIDGYSENAEESITVFTRDGKAKKIPVVESTSEGHGGADEKLRDMLFKEKTDDPLCQMADLRAGVMSIAIGMASNISLKEKRRVLIKEFLKDI
ncbi:MAG: Gfo/Idh/MocA family oxidoreductase [Ruminococcaceae bacterium]|nr:Gfo/Idh/MocA family oxidoreductase [Oscillospiraceae bacterium]